MDFRRIVLAGALSAGLGATEASAQVVCGGATVYQDWACHYTPRIGWHWELEVVGSRSCHCGWDYCITQGRETTCSKWSYLSSCPPAHATCTDHGTACNLPAPDPWECTGPVPPGDREGWALHDGTAGTYTPDGRFSYNSTGNTNEIRHWSTGYYRVNFPGLGGLDGNVQVVAYGPSNARCKVDGWRGMPDLTVDVRCHGPAGQAVNTPFLVYFFATEDAATGAREIGHARYDWSPQPYPPDNPAFQWNSNGPLPTTTRLDAGSYTVRFVNLMHTDGAAVVTAMGTSPEFCQVSSIGRYSAGEDSGTEVRVSCFDTGGRAADSSFTLRYEWQQRVAGAQAQEGYAFAHLATASLYVPLPQFNSAGANVAERSGTGTYRLTYLNLPAPEAEPDPHPEVRASTVLLSARTVNPSYCKVLSWGGLDDRTTVNARCFNNAGALSDRTYQEVYLTRRPPEPPHNP